MGEVAYDYPPRPDLSRESDGRVEGLRLHTERGWPLVAVADNPYGRENLSLLADRYMAARIVDDFRIAPCAIDEPWPPLRVSYVLSLALAIAEGRTKVAALLAEGLAGLS